MNKSFFLFENSPWFILISLLIAISYAFVLYKKKNIWSKKVNYFLATTRAILVFLLCLLLVGPIIKRLINTFEKPTFVFAIDNSSSINEVTPKAIQNQVKSTLKQLKTSLEEKDINVLYQTFEHEKAQLDTLHFSYQSTNLNNLLSKIQTDYEGKNLAGALLISDGLYNQGFSPTYSDYTFPIYTLGLGDTIPKKDIKISSVRYNKIAYQGNQFPLVIEISHDQLYGKITSLEILQNGKTIKQQSISLPNNTSLLQLEFYIDAQNAGIQHFQIKIDDLPEEFNKKNNKKDIFIEVVDGKQKILIAAASPHPDIKAIKSSLEKNKNYEIQLYIPNLYEYKEDKYDLIIFHQLPSSKINYQTIRSLLEKKIPQWFIVSSQTNISSFNTINNTIRFMPQYGKSDQVIPAFNASFQAFTLSDQDKGVINNYPPITTPYGNLSIENEFDVILYQRVGNVVTQKPMLFVNSKLEKKKGILMGEGIWRWKLTEFAKNNKHDAFDMFISKFVQYLASKEDKRKFKVYPIKNEFINNEKIVFETEMYNQLFEPVFGGEVSITLKNSQGKTFQYDYTPSPNNTQYAITGLPQGVYKYNASTVLNNKKEESNGEFSVKALQIETVNLTANHALLRTLSQKTDGTFYTLKNIDQLSNTIQNKTFQTIIHSQETFTAAIHFPWVLALLLTLVTTEWFVRKYQGGY